MLYNAETPSEKEQHIGELKQSIHLGNLVVITGTGASLQIAKRLEVDGFEIASWLGLLNHGIKRCQSLDLIDKQRADRLRQQINCNDVEKMIQVANIVQDKMRNCSSGTLQRWLEDTISKLEIGNPQLAIAIENLGGILATLNYDDLLEQQTKRVPITWNQDYWVSKVINEEKVRSHTGEYVHAVLHLHGYWNNANSIVFGTASYGEVISNAHAQAIQQMFAVGRTMLFIGCDRTLDDPNFRQLTGWANKVLANTGKRHYILYANGQVKDFRRNTPNVPWLHPIGYGEKYDDLTPFIENLGKSRVESTLEVTSIQFSITSRNDTSFAREWHLLTITVKPEVLVDVLLLSRKQVAEKLEDLVSGKYNELCLQTHFPCEIITFIAAFLASRDMLKSPEGQRWHLIRNYET